MKSPAGRFLLRYLILYVSFHGIVQLTKTPIPYTLSQDAQPSAAYKTVTFHNQASDLFTKEVILLYDANSEDQVFPRHTCMSWTLRPFEPPH